MTTSEQFAREVRTAVESKPYQVVDETADGFSMQLDVVDAQWFSLYRRNSLEKTWTWVVRVRGDSYIVQDRPTSVSWEAGVGGDLVPRLRFTASARRGTFVELSRRKTIALNDQGQVDAVVDYTFDSREGKKIITDVAERLGLRRRMDGATKIGLVAGIVGVGGALVALFVLWLTGAF